MSPIHLVARTLLPLCLGGCIVLPPPRPPAPPAPKPAPLPTTPFPTSSPADSTERPPAFVINRPAPQPPPPVPVQPAAKAATPSKPQPAAPPPESKPAPPPTQALALITDTTLDIPAAEPSPIVKELTLPEPLALRTRAITTVAALSDAEALGPIIEREPPPYDHALMQRMVVERAIRPVSPPVRCKAVRSRDRQGEKITISCANNSKEAQTVFLQIKAVGMTGLPPPDAEKTGYALKPGANQRLVTLVADSRSPRAEIHFTHQPRK